MLTKHKRIKNKKVIKEIRSNRCELCGAYTTIEPHHVNTVGSGGGDIKENLIQLCTTHHIAAHDGTLSKAELIELIAQREGLSINEVYVINRRAMGYDVPF